RFRTAAGRARSCRVRGEPPGRDRSGARTACGLRRSRRAVGTIAAVIREETIQVTGIRCERCVNRLAAALLRHDGLETASANLMGQVTLSWDDERTDREAIVAALAAGGFRESAPV